MNKKINQAIQFAALAHKNQKRKGSGVPYISHPFSVAMYLNSKFCSDNVIIAALFHDLLEDTKIKKTNIEALFGSEVLKIVEDCTDENLFDWKKRKLATFEKIKSGNDNLLKVSMADKMHNMLSMLEDFEIVQDKIWKKFRKAKSDYLWYFSELQKIYEIKSEIMETKSIYSDFLQIFNKFNETFNDKK
ncbi:MAG: bifunctional (p)ppGpp synthetase/guanosine-3',5'-bis(diphosphate) 3'-pyrophosphohydrolase [Bacteroidales bacterium]|nr:bifunctional (p)ppGpp synthetase/guanosine-3',5'-bis(diphosphate) 3'-pyrophosphohydrolase [Bacteroidales bacterium]